MRRQYFLGIDLGSSSVKASLVDAETGKCAATTFYPEHEAPIIAVKSGWAEQDTDMWWENCKLCIKKVKEMANASAEDIKAIGISYQMHGLVCVDKDMKALRPAIIWCDSRAVPYGERAFNDLGADRCLGHLLNSPGNFTAAKLAWVKENEPELFSKIYKFMLPGDFIAMKLSGTINTTASGLSEGILWDFKERKTADFVLDYYGIDRKLVADIVPTFSVQCEVSAEAAAETGLQEGTPISYRAGPAKQRTEPQRVQSWRNSLNGRHIRSGIWRVGKSGIRQEKPGKHLRTRELHSRDGPSRRVALYQRNWNSQRLDKAQHRTGRNFIH